MAQDLSSYEELVESLVQEIERYGNARASVENARQELIKLQARVEAVGKQAEESARLSAQLLEEIRRFTPEHLTSPILETLTAIETDAEGRYQELRDSYTHLEQSTTDALAADDGKAVARHQELHGLLSGLERTATDAKSTQSGIAAEINVTSASLVRVTRVVYTCVALNLMVILLLLLR